MIASADDKVVPHHWVRHASHSTCAVSALKDVIYSTYSIFWSRHFVSRTVIVVAFTNLERNDLYILNNFILIFAQSLW